MPTAPPTLKEAIDDLTKALVNANSILNGLDKGNLPELLKGFKTLTEEKNRLDDLVKIVNDIHSNFSHKVLPEAFRTLGVDSIKTAGRNFILNTKMRANITKEQQEAGFAWLRANGYEDLIRPSVNANSLSSVVNGFFEEHAKLPPEEAISIFTQEYISMRKV